METTEWPKGSQASCGFFFNFILFLNFTRPHPLPRKGSFHWLPVAQSFLRSCLDPCQPVPPCPPAVRRPCHGLHTLPSRPFPPASKPHRERSRPFLALPSSSQHTAHTGPVQSHARLNTLTPAPELTVLCRTPERGHKMQPLLKALRTVSPHPPLTTPRARGVRPRLCSQCRSGPPNPSPHFISPRDRSNSAPLLR